MTTKELQDLARLAAESQDLPAGIGIIVVCIESGGPVGYASNIPDPLVKRILSDLTKGVTH